MTPQHLPPPARRLAIVAVLGLAAIRAGAQQPRPLAPLSQFLQRAAAQNFDNREAQAVLVQRQRESDAAWARLLPSVTLQTDAIKNQYLGTAEIPTGTPSANGILTTRRVVITPLDQRDASAVASVPLIDLNAMRAAQAAHATRDAQEARVRMTRLDVQKTVAHTWYQLAGALGVARAARQTLAAAVDNVCVLATRVEAGLASDLDVKRAQAEVERDKQAVADADYTVGNLSRSLTAVTGADVMVDTSTTPPTLAPDDLHAEAPLTEWGVGLSAVPSVEAAARDRHANELSASAARGTLLPSISAQLTQRSTNAVGFGRSPYYVLELLGTWKLDLSAASTARAQQSAATAAAVRADRALVDATNAVTDAWEQVQSQIANVRATRSSLEASRAALSVARDRYTSGRATTLDVVQAERDAFSAEVTSLQAEADLAWARANLRLTSGRALEGR